MDELKQAIIQNDICGETQDTAQARLEKHAYHVKNFYGTKEKVKGTYQTAKLDCSEPARYTLEVKPTGHFDKPVPKFEAKVQTMQEAGITTTALDTSADILSKIRARRDEAIQKAKAKTEAESQWQVTSMVNGDFVVHHPRVLNDLVGMGVDNVKISTDARGVIGMCPPMQPSEAKVYTVPSTMYTGTVTNNSIGYVTTLTKDDVDRMIRESQAAMAAKVDSLESMMQQLKRFVSYQSEQLNMLKHQNEILLCQMKTHNED